MKNIFLSFLCCFGLSQMHAQTTAMPKDALPFYQIPDAPATYSAENVVARMIDGLGYRYFWATEGLRAEDLAYRPSEDSRETAHTLDHLVGLSNMIVTTISQQPNVRPRKVDTLSFEEMRAVTLNNLKKASDILRASEANSLQDRPIIFKRNEQVSEVPFWNLLNGPIADALYHVGQIVAFRRASGNPLDPRVNVFMGKTRE